MCMTRSSKKTLVAIIKDQNPSDKVFHTLFYYIEYNLNSKPLESVFIDPHDKVSISPNDILIA